MTLILLLAAAATATVAQPAVAESASATRYGFSLGQTFTFLFLTLGPLKIIGPFASMTRGQDVAYKRQLAFEGILIAAAAAFVAATIGSSILRKWGVSLGALLLTAGVLLFLIALRSVMEQYAVEPRSEAAAPAAPGSRPGSLAFSPLAFPTIITPYGIAMLVVLVMLRSPGTTMGMFITLVAAVLFLDLLAMLFADSILKPPFVAPVLGIVGAVVGVLQIALGVQAMASGVRALSFVAAQGK